MDASPPNPHSLSPRALTATGWAAFIVAGSVFLAIAWSVSSRAPIVTFDAQVSEWLHAHATPGLTSIMLVVTHANSTVAISVYGVIFALVLARMREWYWMLTVALSIAGGLALNVLFKHAFERARPHFDHAPVALETYSFPSGHTAAATVFYGVLAAFLVSRTHDKRLRAALVIGAIAAVVLVAFTRVYLGAHYPSDVVAAAAASTAWLTLCLATVHGWVRRRRATR
jgi:undecaprenyl-diphosphatase